VMATRHRPPRKSLRTLLSKLRAAPVRRTPIGCRPGNFSTPSMICCSAACGNFRRRRRTRRQPRTYPVFKQVVEVCDVAVERIQPLQHVALPVHGAAARSYLLGALQKTPDFLLQQVFDGLFERHLPREDGPRPFVDVRPQFAAELNVVVGALVQVLQIIPSPLSHRRSRSFSSSVKRCTASKSSVAGIGLPFCFFAEHLGAEHAAIP